MLLLSNNKIYKYCCASDIMAGLEKDSLDKTIKIVENNNNNKRNVLEKFTDIDASTKVNASKRLPIPDEIIEQHFHKKLYKKVAAKEINNEFVFLYTQGSHNAKMILTPVNNYIALFEVTEYTEELKKLKDALVECEYIRNINLILENGKYNMEGVPNEFRIKGQRMSFLSDNELYITMDLTQNYVFKF